MTGDALLFGLRIGLGFIPGASSILEVAMPVGAFVMNRGKIALANRVGAKKKDDGADAEAPAGEEPQTLDDAAAKLRDVQLQPREALALMYEQGALTLAQYEALLVTVHDYEAEQAKEAAAEVQLVMSDDLVASVDALAQELKGVEDTQGLQRTTVEVMKRRTRSCGICKRPGVDRRSHVEGHKNAHLHDFTVFAQPVPPSSPKTPGALGKAKSAPQSPPSTDKRRVTCSKCGAFDVNATSHVLGHEKAYLHDFTRSPEAK